MSAGHYENFPVASLFLPSRLRPAILAIYRFARAADDVADEGAASADERLAQLAVFDRALDAIAAGDRPREAPFADLADTMERHALPLQLFRDLLSAFRQDVTVKRYPGYVDVLDYCRRSANPIGRLLLHLYHADTPPNQQWSDAVCTALQLINFWQDIAPDWHRGRVYLPQEDLERFGVEQSQIARARCDDAWRELMAFETARTRALLESGRPLTCTLPWRCALELKGVLAGGHRILDGIEAAHGDVFRHRPRIAGLQWGMVGLHALFPPARHRECAVVPMPAVKEQ